jgi:nucleoid DNA-binding protein
MTQAQMTAYLAAKVGISKRQAKSMFDEPNELVTRQLKQKGSLRLASLGVFRKRKLKARMGRNPVTGEQIKIPARTRLRFTPARALKASVLGVRLRPARMKGAYQLPRLELLDNPPLEKSKADEVALAQRARVLEQKLAGFGVPAQVIAMQPGPVVTLYKAENWV